MSIDDLAHLELLAEIDALARRLDDWSHSAPPWRPAETCQAIIGRLAGRLNSLRIRLESPLIVATLGGYRNRQELADQRPGRGGTGPIGSQPAKNDPPGTTLLPGPTPEILGMDARELTWSKKDLPVAGKPGSRRLPRPRYDRCPRTPALRHHAGPVAADPAAVRCPDRDDHAAEVPHARGRRGACRRRPGSTPGFCTNPFRPGRRCTR